MERRRGRWRAAFRVLWLAPPVVIGGMWARSCTTMDEVSAVDADGVLRAAVSYGGAVHWIRAENNSTERPAAWDTYDAPPGAAWGALYAMDDMDWRRLGFAAFSSPRPAAPANAVSVNAGAANVGPAVVGAAGGVRGNGDAADVAAADGRAIAGGGADVGEGNAGGGRSPGRPTRAAAGAVVPAPPPRPRQVAPWLFTRPYKAYALPYWFPLAVTSVPAGVMVARMIRRFSRRRRGLCPGCGYDLRAGGDRCPECGEEVAGTRAMALSVTTSPGSH